MHVDALYAFTLYSCLIQLTKQHTSHLIREVFSQNVYENSSEMVPMEEFFSFKIVCDRS